MINGAYYVGKLRRLHQEIERKRGKLTRGFLLLQENAPAHTSQVAMTVATECRFVILPHPILLIWLLESGAVLDCIDS